MNYKKYINILDPDSTLSINLTESNWKYAGNFFNTVYQLYFYDASNFCVNLSADINYITGISSPSSSLYIPEDVDCRITQLNSSTNINTTNSLCIKPSVTVNVTYTPAQITEMNNTFLYTSGILIIILIIIVVLYWYFNRNSESSINKNDYYYV